MSETPRWLHARSDPFSTHALENRRDWNQSVCGVHVLLALGHFAEAEGEVCGECHRASQSEPGASIAGIDDDSITHAVVTGRFWRSVCGVVAVSYGGLAWPEGSELPPDYCATCAGIVSDRRTR